MTAAKAAHNCRGQSHNTISEPHRRWSRGAGVSAGVSRAGVSSS